MESLCDTWYKEYLDVDGVALLNSR